MEEMESMGKHDDYRHEHHRSNCDCDHDDIHHSYDHKPKPADQSCSVANVRTFGSAMSETTYPKTIKVPVTLAEPSVIVCVEAEVRLEKPALEIKRVLKSVILEQCELVNTFDPHKAKLFVRGFIRKNIEYATVDTASDRTVCGDIRHTTALIPFDFCTDLTFPTAGPTLQLAPDFSSSGQLLDCTGHGAQLNAALLGNRQVYNNKPYCQLVFAEFTELDIGRHLKTVNCYEKTFSVLQEKIVMKLGLKVLQEQQVPIPTLFVHLLRHPPFHCPKK